jgi:hypothetical protein
MATTEKKGNGKKAMAALNGKYKCNDFFRMKETLVADWPKISAEFARLEQDNEVFRKALELELKGIVDCPRFTVEKVKFMCLMDVSEPCSKEATRRQCWAECRIGQALMIMAKADAKKKKRK